MIEAFVDMKSKKVKWYWNGAKLKNGHSSYFDYWSGNKEQKDWYFYAQLSCQGDKITLIN